MKRLIKKSKFTRLKIASDWDDDDPVYEWDGDESAFDKIERLYVPAILTPYNEIYISRGLMDTHQDLMGYAHDDELRSGRVYLTPSEKKIELETPRNIFAIWQEQNGDQWPTVDEVRAMPEYAENVELDKQEWSKQFPGWSIIVQS